MIASATYYLDTATHIEIRPPRNGRGSLSVENLSANDIYYAEDMMANSDNGITLATMTRREWANDGTKAAVPQGSIWITGSQAAPTRQRVIVRWS